jgi:hypothetical protein
MININEERRRSINATPHDPATRTSCQVPRRTNKNRTGQKAASLFVPQMFVLFIVTCNGSDNFAVPPVFLVYG